MSNKEKNENTADFSESHKETIKIAAEVKNAIIRQQLQPQNNDGVKKK